ncbi:MAG: S-methyl-5-thioribose-1-phosphate isomerase [Deltaproteobacteria bacterium]|nr:S-methyl-5-thioribose-1-phosphate isomerase [Deltaproteobacteria bacterium]
MVPTIQWQDNRVRMIDQRKLPHRVEWYTCKGYKDVVRAIERMVVRGAPAIGIAAAMGLALGAASIRDKSYSRFRGKFQRVAGEMLKARPTAVNLRWAVERMTRIVDRMVEHSVEAIKERLEEEAESILAEDIEINKKIGKNGAKLIPKAATILTHCNAGSLATGGFGTALGVIRAAREAGKSVSVIADETRPWLQGLRLTAFELMEDGIPVQVIVDSAAGYFMQAGKIDLVITGADRIAANGDVVNKIGTYQLAVLAKENRVPFYVAAPISTIDLDVGSGDQIPVEERDPKEVSHFGKRMIGPKGVKALNPAFDVTPARYVSAIITERGVIRPPFKNGIRKITRKS